MMRDLRALRTEADYEWALGEIERYFDNEPAVGSVDGDRFEILATLIKAYEDQHVGIKHYEYNTRLSEAFYTPIQGLEICIRNSMSLELTALLGLDWYDNKHGIFQHPATEMIEHAKRNLTQDGKPIVAGRMIPELNFGFWAAVLGPRYDTSLWVPALRKSFPHRPKGTERTAVHKAINAVRRLRNRVAHHEPILHRKLNDDHELILKLVSWCCADTCAWVSSMSRLPAVLAGK